MRILTAHDEIDRNGSLQEVEGADDEVDEELVSTFKELLFESNGSNERVELHLARQAKIRTLLAAF